MDEDECAHYKDGCPTAGHPFSFWELHRMLADCYMTDLEHRRPMTDAQLLVYPGATPGNQLQGSLSMRSMHSSATQRASLAPDVVEQLQGSSSMRSAEPRSSATCSPGTRFLLPAPGRPQESPSLPRREASGRRINGLITRPLVPSRPEAPDHGSIPKLHHGRTQESLQSLMTLHGLKKQAANSSIDVSSLTLKTHSCWESVDNSQAKKTPAKQRSKSRATASLKSSTVGRLVLGSANEGTRGSCRCMIHPCGTFRLYWCILVAAFVMHDLLVIPMLVFTLPPWFKNFWTAVVIQIFWVCDFVLNFFTGYYDRGLLVIDFRRVAAHYACTWMLCDFLLLLIDWTTNILDLMAYDQAPGDWSQTVRMVRLLRLVRIMRAIKLRQGFMAVQDLLQSQAASLYFNFFVSLAQLLLQSHWVACAWFGVTWLNERNWLIDSGMSDDATFHYLKCLLWSFCQLGVGESPLQPVNNLECLLNVAIAFRSLITTATLISTMSGLIAGLRKLREDEVNEFRLLRRFLQQSDIPHELGQKVTQFLQHQYSEQQHQTSLDLQVPLLRLLSRPMFQELQFERHRASLIKIGVIKELLSEDAVHGLRTLHQMAFDSLRPVLAAAGDVIFLSGYVAVSAYLQITGHVCYFKDESEQTLDDERWVAEMCLWAPWVHMGDLEAQSTSQLLSLDAETFCSTMAHDSYTQEACSGYARKFLEKMDGGGLLSDLVVEKEPREEEEEEHPILLPSSFRRLLRKMRTQDVDRVRQVVPESSRSSRSGRSGRSGLSR